jgi:hypothetical protein
MYKHYSVSGNVQDLTDEQAGQMMDSISTQWEDEKTPLGRLYMGVFDWAYSKTDKGIILDIPNLRTGGAIPLNENAKKVFGFDIFGDCFLKLGK